ncbi:MAG: hypothetical protein AABX85_03280 [Nanoarchaeota archaeon]
MGLVAGVIVLLVGLIFLVFPKLIMLILRPKTSIYTINPARGYKKGFQSPRPAANEIYGQKATLFVRIIGIIFIIVSIFIFLN